MIYVTILFTIYFFLLLLIKKIIGILFVLKFEHNELIHFIRFNRKLLWFRAL